MNRIVKEEIEKISEKECRLHFWIQNKKTKEITKRDEIFENFEDARKKLEEIKQAFFALQRMELEEMYERGEIVEEDMESEPSVEEIDEKVETKDGENTSLNKELDEKAEIRRLKNQLNEMKTNVEKLEGKVSVLWFIVILLPIIYMVVELLGACSAIMSMK